MTATIEEKDGRRSQIHAEYVVGCDGASSIVRKQLGLNFLGDTAPTFFFVIDCQVLWEYSSAEVIACLCKGSMLAFFPLQGEHMYRIVGILPPSVEDPEGVQLEELLNQVRRQSELPLEIREVIWHSIFRVHSRKAEHFRAKRGFIAGDAGHIHTPAGGQGMNTGIQDSYNLAWKLALVLKGKAREQILNSYDNEREGNARNLLQTTDRLFQIQMSTGKLTTLVRMHIFPYIARLVFSLNIVKKAIFPFVSQIGITYKNSPLTIASCIGRINAGDRFPYFLIDGKSSFESLKGLQFHIVIFDSSSEGTLLKQVTEQRPNEPIVLVKSIPRKYFSRENHFFALIRPDKHIAYIGRDLSALILFFEKWFK